MMTFRDLKFPKELSKKKKLELYKCWILTPLDKGSEERILDLNWDSDRYGLSEKAAIALELNKIGIDNLINNINIIESFSGKCFVIMKITLAAGTMDEDVIIPPENSTIMDMDPHYDPILGTLNVTIHQRVADMEIKNYSLNDIAIEVDENTNIINVVNIDLHEQVINHSVTGGK